MGRRHKEMFYEIPFFHVSAGNALAAAMLFPVSSQRQSFNISFVGDNDGHIFLCNEVFYIKFRCRCDNLRAALVTEAFFNFHDIFFDDIQYQLVARQNCLIFFNLSAYFFVFFLDLSLFESGQPLEFHIQDCIGLNF